MKVGLADKLIVPVPVLLIISLALAWYLIPKNVVDMARESSVQSALQTVNQFKVIRAYYTENVVKKVIDNGGVRPSAGHAHEADGIPLPATFILDLSALLQNQDTNIALYSGFPFPGRSERVLDGFQQEAWASLSANPDAVFSKQESVGGKTLVRVAIADRMVAEACVACHNSHPNSPKTGWKLGDVRGVLEVVSDISAPVAAATALSNKILLYGGIIALMVIAVSMYFSRYITGGLAGTIAIMDRLAKQGADGDVEIAGLTRLDEFGSMARSLEVFKDNAIEKARLEQARAQDRAAREAERASVVELNSRLQGDIDATVQAAGQGDFSRRIDSTQYHGSMKQVSDGLNQLLETVDGGVSETVEVLSAMARGDLTRRMTGHYQGNFLRLKNDANTMAKQIAMIAGQIAEVSNAVNHTTSEITAGVGNLSTRTEHQAASLQDNTASMEELSATVKQNADNAQEANRVAIVARLSAANGGEVVGEAVEAMSRIEGSSKKISEIVGLIQEIAFQTNLLALNAAVEAARAGDAGKGFAVVANEVRALAQRSAQASKDIKELIVVSDNEVRDGVELVNRAGASLEEIVGSVKKVADFVSEIATASQEQSSGIDQVSQAINSMEEMTQQNGALVEETTTALQSAQTQVGDLREVVAFFKTGQKAMAMPKTGVDERHAAGDSVHRQQTSARRAVAGGAAVANADGGWQEF